jgi:hypothetical protein
MSLQRQNLAPAKPIILRTLAFVLPGRRTLSEHLPAEIIDLPVSLAERSTHLRKVIVVHALEKPYERQIHLPGVDSVGFRFYVEWLGSGRIDFKASAVSKSASGLLLRDCFDLMFAHIVGSHFEEPDFQDYIIDVMVQNLSASQTPDLKVLEEVFLEKSISNVLRQFVIDRMFAVERKMLGMMRGTLLPTAEGEAGCEYHSHEAGNCYRDNVKHARAHTDATLANTNVGTNDSNTHHFDDDTMPYSLTESPTNYTHQSQSSAISNTKYTGPDEWCRELHGSIPSVELPNLQRYEKPLPAIPLPTPGATASPPSSRPLSPASIKVLPTSDSESDQDKAIELPSTQQLIQECLLRLPNSHVAQSHSCNDLPSTSKAARPDIVLDCLRRLNLLPTNDAPERDNVDTRDNASRNHTADAVLEYEDPDTGSNPESADDVSLRSSASADTQCELDFSGRSSPKQVSPFVSPVLRSLEIHHERRFDELPSTAYHSTPEESIGVPREPYPIAGPYKRAEKAEYYGPRKARPRSQAERARPQSRHRESYDRLQSPILQESSALEETRPVFCELSGESLALHNERQQASTPSPRTTTARPKSHLGFSHHETRHVGQSQHPYAHLGLSKPRPRIVDSQSSRELLCEEPGVRDKGKGKAPQHIMTNEKQHVEQYEDRELAFGISSAMNKKQRQRWLIATSLPPLPRHYVLGSVKRKPAPTVNISPVRSSSPSPHNAAPLRSETPNATAASTSRSTYLPRYMAPSAPEHPTARPTSLPQSEFDFSFSPDLWSPAGNILYPLRRKPAPERGADWLEQQSRNPFAAEAGEGSAAGSVRRSRKSRLGEILRSSGGTVNGRDG